MNLIDAEFFCAFFKISKYDTEFMLSFLSKHFIKSLAFPSHINIYILLLYFRLLDIFDIYLCTPSFAKSSDIIMALVFEKSMLEFI